MRRRRITTTYAVGLALGCALVAGFAYGGPQRGTGAVKQNRDAKEAILLPSERDAIETAIKAKLRNRSSVRFGEMAAKRTERGVLVCGFINAKNFSGRYTSRAPFIGTLNGNGFEVSQISGPEISEKRRVVDLCEALGVSIGHQKFPVVVGKHHRRHHHS